MAERQQELIDRYSSDTQVDHAGLAHARQQLGHPEQYRLDMWRTGDAPTDDD
jgi:hypothetical protein